MTSEAQQLRALPLQFRFLGVRVFVGPNSDRLYAREEANYVPTLARRWQPYWLGEAILER
jgi:hypothetical protein